MPDQAKTYHPSSFASATTAVAEDLERIADSLRDTLIAIDYPKVRDAVERIDHQAAGLRAIALKSYRDDWPTHLVVDWIGRPPLDPTVYPPVDPDEDGPSWDDPIGGR